MAWSLASLKDRFYLWAVSKAAVYGFKRLTAQSLGLKLNQAMDDRFGKDRSDLVQMELASWLEAVAKELRT